MNPGFYLHTGNRLERLAQGLAELLRDSATDIFVPRKVVVQSRGMAHWLSLRVADHNGICANVEFPFPAAFMNDVMDCLAPEPMGGDTYDKEVMALGLMELIAEVPPEPAFARLKHYLADDPVGRKRFQLAQRIAGCFDQYLLYRPQMIQAWNRNRGLGDQTGPVRGDLHWQAALWRKLRQRLPQVDRTLVFERLLQTLDSEGLSLGRLANPVVVFGITQLPPLYLQVLRGLARHLPVHLFLLNPCQAYWADILPSRQATKMALRNSARAAPEDLHLTTGNPLLANLGKVGRDFLNTLWSFDELQERHLWEAPGADDLLSATQQAIFTLHQRDPADPSPDSMFGTGDRSIQVHACHGPMREVEVLYDQLLGMLADETTLDPHQICVMAPDIETYAPLIRAVFGNPEGHLPRLPFSIADRRLRIESRTIAAFAHLLEMVPGRYGVTNLATLLEFDAVRQRFGLTEPDVSLAMDWIQRSGMHWGRDAEDRRLKEGDQAAVEAGVPPGPAGSDRLHTWRFGLERLLLGYAMEGEPPPVFDGMVPVTDIAPDQFEALGRFVAFGEVLIDVTRKLEQPHTLGQWASVLGQVLDTMLVDDDRNAAELQALRTLFDQMAHQADQAGCRSLVDIQVVQAYMERFFNQRRGGGGFLRQGITFCAMVPMRSIPFRVIAVLGLDLDAFPRRDQPLSFDLMAAEPMPGDPSQRADDRYLFLETLLSARQTLYLSYVGRDIRDNTLRPPSVMTEELMAWLGSEFGVSKAQVVTTHRLQPFHPDYFKESGALFSFSEKQLAASRAFLSRNKSNAYRLVDPLDPPPETWREISAQRLGQFFEHPLRFFWQQRLGVRFASSLTPPLEDQAPLYPNALQAYQLDHHVLEHLARGADASQGRAIEQGRGALPGGPIGEVVYGTHHSQVASFVDQLPEVARRPENHTPVDLQIGTFRIRGDMAVYGAGHLVQLRYANLKARDHLKAWVAHLVWCAACQAKEGHAPLTILVGKDKAFRFQTVPDAAELLMQYLELYWQGCSAPLSLYPQTSLAYAQQMHKDSTAHRAALQKAYAIWRGSQFSQSEAEDPYVQRSVGGAADMADILDPLFCRIACQVFSPLLQSQSAMALQAMGDMIGGHGH